MITPVDIRNQPFKKAIRGFDTDEVKNFLNSLSQEWEALIIESKSLKIELEKTKENLASYREMEAMLHKTLITAEQSSRSVVENANKEALLKIQEAEQQANQIVQGALLDADMKRQEAEQRSANIVQRAYEERSRVEMEVNALIHRKQEILNQLSLYLAAQLDRIKLFEQNEVQLVKKEDSQISHLPSHSHSNSNGSISDNLDTKNNIPAEKLSAQGISNGVVIQDRPVHLNYSEPLPEPKLHPIEMEKKEPQPIQKSKSDPVSVFLSETTSFFDRALGNREVNPLTRTIVDEL